jgi:hypothetical protein
MKRTKGREKKERKIQRGPKKIGKGKRKYQRID